MIVALIIGLIVVVLICVAARIVRNMIETSIRLDNFLNETFAVRGGEDYEHG